jgi:L-rhamnose mutarotase
LSCPKRVHLLLQSVADYDGSTMERSLYYVRLFPGTEERYDEHHARIPPEVADEMRAAGLRDVTGFRRGTDVWWYAQCEPDRTRAFRAYAQGRANKHWGKRFRDVIAEVEAPRGGLIWYDEVFHTDAPAPDGPFERACFSLVIDPRAATYYDNLHADAWPEMLDAIATAGYRDYSGFRRGAQVVYVGRFYPDFETVIERVNATDVAARWAKALEGVITAITDSHGRNFTATELYHQD